MVPISRPETSVRNYHYCLRNNLEERSSQTVLVFDLPQSVLFCFLSCVSWWPAGVDAGFYTVCSLVLFKLRDVQREDVDGVHPPQAFRRQFH